MQPNEPLFPLTRKRVWVAGHNGMVGSAIVRRLEEEHCDILVAGRAEVDLTNQSATARWVDKVRPDAVFLCAARVGGIYANSVHPADFIAENLAISLNVIQACFKAHVTKLLNLGSSCIYPRDAPQPIHEDALLTGPLESTNQWYAIAKIAAIKLCQAYRIQYGSDFISAMPTNLYGQGDSYDLDNCHVPAALIRRFHEAKIGAHPSVTVWGSGAQRREFLSADDLADACVFLMKFYSGVKFINIGTGRDISIAEFAKLVAEVVGYNGSIVFDMSRPDGPRQKLLDIKEMNGLGWIAKVQLRDGVRNAYADFLARKQAITEGNNEPAGKQNAGGKSDQRIYRSQDRVRLKGTSEMRRSTAGVGERSV